MALSGGVFRQFLAVLFMCLSKFVIGSSLGWPSPVILSIEKTGQPFNMSHDEVAVMVSMVYVGNVLSPIPSGFFMDLIGRKTTLHIMTLIPITSWILIYFATSAVYLHFARLLVGVWNGAASTIVVIYVAEVSEPSVRGSFSLMSLFMLYGGLLAVYLMGSKMDYYGLVYVLGSVPIVISIVLTFIPESPYWYVKRHQHDKALRALAWFRAKGPEEVKDELARIESSVSQEMKRGSSYRDLLRTAGNRRALLSVVVLSVMERASGISALFAYASTTLPGGLGPLSVNDCVTLIGFTVTLCICISMFFVYNFGRRPLLIFSAVCSGIMQTTIATWFLLNSKTDVDVSAYSWVPLASLLAYSVFFSLGIGPLPTTIQGELFPTNIKGLASGITAISLALTSFLTNIAYQRIADTWGMHVNYYLFAAACLVAAVFTATCLVETKGKTLQEIQRALNEKRGRNLPQ